MMYEYIIRFFKLVRQEKKNQKKNYIKEAANTLFNEWFRFNEVHGLEFWRSKVFNILIDVILVFALPLFFWGAFLFYKEQDYYASFFELLAYTLIIIAVKTVQINEMTRRTLGVIFVYLTGIVLLLFAGNLGCGLVLILFSFVLAGFVLNVSNSLRIISLNFIIIIILSLLLQLNMLDQYKIASFKTVWLINIIPTEFMGLLAYVLMNLIIKGLNRQTEMIKDTTELLTYRDSLTGLYNRIFLEREKKRLDRKEFLPLSVIVGDVNGLKVINDALGHLEGDRLLMTMAMILQDCCREKDVVVRLGGDEFCILLPQTGDSQADLLMHRITEACMKHNNEHKYDSFFMSISLGKSTRFSMDDSVDMHFKLADDHMYKSKNMVSNNIQNSIILSMKDKMFNTCGVSEKHCEALAEITHKMGISLGFSEEMLSHLRLLSLMHDIGKVSVSQDILHKRSDLSQEEVFELEQHAEIGYRIAKVSNWLNPIADSILMHHARWDGKGYPRHVKGESITIFARILAVADVACSELNKYVEKFEHKSEHSTEHRPEHSTEHKPEHNTEHKPEHNTEHRPEYHKKNKIASVLFDKAGSELDPSLVDLFIQRTLNSLE